MAMPARIHDPLFHFETHFPERLSRLHITPDHAQHPVQRRNRKARTDRNAARYKTQPVTFDEIQEVDEDNIKEEEKKTDGLRHQFSAFSKSMDGLVPKPKKRDKYAIMESADDCIVQTPNRTVKPKLKDLPKANNNRNAAELRLTEEAIENKENKENEPGDQSTPEVSHSPLGLPPAGPHVHVHTHAHQRRLRTTAKAKRRQMNAEGSGGGDANT